MDDYKQTLKYNYLNIAFKILVIIALVLFIIFYFKIDIFNLKFFKTKNHKDKKYIYKSYDVNRNLVNAITKENYSNKTLSDFFIKTSFNCCNIGYGTSNVERLKTIISQGFRCLDFKLIYKNNTIHIENQPKNETFYNALEIINTHCFSNSYCNNNQDLVVINIRFDENITKSELKLAYKKLREMFKTLNSSKIDSSYSVLQGIENPEKRNKILSMSLNDIGNKIIVMCNYDYTKVDDLDYEHDLLQYIHFNTYVPSADVTANNIQNTLDTNTAYNNNAIISMRLNDIIKADDTDLINLNKTYPLMLIPNSLNNISAVENPTSLEDLYGYTFRSLEFSSIVDFSKEIIDSDIKLYIDRFNITNSAFILKPNKLRNDEEV